MPVKMGIALAAMPQAEFGEVAYTVMGEAFAVHGELGRLFDEKVYQAALAARVPGLRTEIPVDVTFDSFRKTYFLDAVAPPGAIFEFKAVQTLTQRHRGQLLNYPLLTDARHGKLVNFQNAQVEHEFVNATHTTADRRGFTVDDTDWYPVPGFGNAERELTIAMVHDWGAGLERALYEEALVHFLGGGDRVWQTVHVCLGGIPVGQQVVPMPAPETALRVTTFEAVDPGYERHLASFCSNTGIPHAIWINIQHRLLTLRTVPHFSPSHFSPSHI